MKIAGTFDIECGDWDRFVLGVTYRPGIGAEIWRDPDAMLDEMRRVGGTWYAHAGGVYDSLLWIERLSEREIPWQADEHQSRLTRLCVGKLSCRDSYSLFPMPLNELCALSGRPVPSLPWRCTCGEDCGGYCQITKRAAEGDPDLEAYCLADCEVLYDGLRELEARARADGILLAGTLGQTAWKLAKRTLGLPDASYDSWDIWRICEAANYPGQILIARPTSPGPGSHHDLINAYPSALARSDLPVGEVMECGSARATSALAQARPGIYTLTVRVPDSFTPPLPWRIGARVVYPTGTFSGTWCLPELVAAFERGVSIETVHAALVWETSSPIFAELMPAWYELRRRAGAKTAYGQWLSRMAKALCGKLAESPQRHRVLAFPERVRICTRQRGCRNGCTGRCRKYEPLDPWHTIWAAPYWSLPPSAYVHWSAYLRAYTRVQLRAEAERMGTDLVYCNTDSIWSQGRLAPQPISDELGHWRYEHGFTDWECLAPNVYRCRDKQGKAILRAAGAHAIDDAAWRRGGGVLDRGVEHFRSQVRSPAGPKFRRRHRKWTLPEVPADGMFGDRRLDASSGLTYPLDADEWRSILQGNRHDQ